MKPKKQLSLVFSLSRLLFFLDLSFPGKGLGASHVHSHPTGRSISKNSLLLSCPTNERTKTLFFESPLSYLFSCLWLSFDFVLILHLFLLSTFFHFYLLLSLTISSFLFVSVKLSVLPFVYVFLQSLCCNWFLLFF
jgi:hypothetical protein